MLRRLPKRQTTPGARSVLGDVSGDMEDTGHDIVPFFDVMSD